MLVHVLVLAAIKQEHDAMAAELKRITGTEGTLWSNATPRSYRIFLIRQDDQTIRVALAEKTGVGQVDAAIATKDALRDLSPAVVILVGIAGANSELSELRLGDVAVAAGVHDYERGKEQFGGQAPRWRRYDIKVPLISRIETMVDRNSWSRDLIPSLPDRNVPSAYHVGDVLSGNLVMADTQKTKERISQANAKIIAIEMEAAAVIAALRTANPEPAFLMLKAFSDMAGDDKADGAGQKDKWHEYASLSASRFAGHVIQNVLNPEYFDKLNLPRPESYLRSEMRGAVKCYLDSFQDLPGFAVDVGMFAVEEAAREVESLSRLSIPSRDSLESDGGYESCLSRGNRFLGRAYSPFHKAKSIWAISVDVVSTFWKDPHAGTSLKKYLAGQKISKGRSPIKRLFVYSRPEDAHARALLHDWHASGMEGTYVTSLENYQEMLSKLLGKESLVFQRSAVRDFALIECDDNGNTSRVVAELTGEHFRIQRIEDLQGNISGERDDYLNLFRAIEDDLTNIQEGSVSPEFGIIRWQSGIWRKPDVWSELLRRIFADRTADAFHLAGFFPHDKESHDEVRRILAKIKYGGVKPGRSKESYQREMGFEVVRLAKRLPYDQDSPRDGLSQQSLKYEGANIPSSFVMMTFKDQYSLRRFMEDDAHSRLRHDLVFQIAKSQQGLQAKIQSRGITSSEMLSEAMKTDREFARECLEAAEIWRVDMIDDEMIDEMVLARPDVFID